MVKVFEENEYVREFYVLGYCVSVFVVCVWVVCLVINMFIKLMCVGDEMFGDDGDDGMESALETTLRGAAYGAVLERFDLEYKGV